MESLIEINRKIVECEVELELASTDEEHYKWLAQLKELQKEKAEYLEGMENAR